jgi:hypothetical protein
MWHQLYSSRLGPARCPVCGSRYIVTTNKWQPVKWGNPSPRPTQELGAMGLVVGGIAGASKEEEKASERIVNMIVGSIARPPWGADGGLPRGADAVGER